MFTYCNNNPVNLADVGGSIPKELNNFTFPICSDGGGGGFKYGGGVYIPANHSNGSGNCIPDFVNDVVEDFANYDPNNKSEDVVFSANYFSNYKGVFVIKTSLFDAPFSFGVIVLTPQHQYADALNHEYGHYLQLEKYGLVQYFTKIAVPSLVCNLIDRVGWLPWYYYNSPWEYEADQLGGVVREQHTEFAKILSFIYSKWIS